MTNRVLAQRAAVWITALWAAAVAAASATSPEKLLPDGTLGLSEFCLDGGAMDQIRQSTLWELWEDPEVQRFLEQPIRQMAANFEAWLDVVKEEPGLDLRPFFNLLPPRRVCVAFSAFDVVQGDLKAVVLYAEWGDRIDAVHAGLDRILELVRKRAAGKKHTIAVTEREFGGTKIRRVVRSWEEEGFTGGIGDRLEGMTWYPGRAFVMPGRDTRMVERHKVVEFAVSGSVSLFLFGDDPKDETLALERYLAPEKPLSADPVFQAARKKVSGSMPFLYIRADTILEAVAKQAREEEDEENSFDFDALMSALGMTGLKAMAYGRGLEGGDIVDHVYLEMPAPRRGLAAALAGTPLPGERLARFAPADAHMYGEVSIDLAAVWESVCRVVAAATDDAGEKSFRGGAAGVEQRLGTTFAELFANFDTHAAGYMVYPANLMSLGEQGLILPLKKPDTVRAVLTKLRSLPEVAEVLSFADETYKDVEMVSITFRNLTLPFMPSYAFLDDTLIITENPFSLQKLIASVAGGGASLADAEKFKALADQAFPAGASFGMYTDLPEVVERLYGMVAPMMTMFMADPSARSDLAELGFDLSLLPSAKAVARRMRPGWEYVRVDDRGIEYRGRSSFGAGIAGLYTTVGTAVIPFALASGMREAVAEHRQKGSRENLAKLYDAIGIYRRTVGGDRNPRDLMALVNAALVEEDSLAAPADKKPRIVENPETGDRIAVSYRYRPGGFEEKGRGLVLYEAGAWYGGERRLAVFKDGTVRLLWSEREFERLLKGED